MTTIRNIFHWLKSWRLVQIRERELTYYSHTSQSNGKCPVHKKLLEGKLPENFERWSPEVEKKIREITS